TLVRPHLKLLSRILVHVGRTQHRKDVSFRRERHRPRHPRPGPPGRLDDPLGRAVENLVIEGLQTDADLLSHTGHCLFLLARLPDMLRRNDLRSRFPVSPVAAPYTAALPGNPT